MAEVSLNLGVRIEKMESDESKKYALHPDDIRKMFVMITEEQKEAVILRFIVGNTGRPFSSNSAPRTSCRITTGGRSDGLF